MSELRDRIAKALLAVVLATSKAKNGELVFTELADAVIRELSLMIDDSYRISYGTAFIVHGYYEMRDDA